MVSLSLPWVIAKGPGHDILRFGMSLVRVFGLYSIYRVSNFLLLLFAFATRIHKLWKSFMVFFHFYRNLHIQSVDF